MQSGVWVEHAAVTRHIQLAGNCTLDAICGLQVISFCCVFVGGRETGGLAPLRGLGVASRAFMGPNVAAARTPTAHRPPLPRSASGGGADASSMSTVRLSPDKESQFSPRQFAVAAHIGRVISKVPSAGYNS
jgi:hypothetical protein